MCATDPSERRCSLVCLHNAPAAFKEVAQSAGALDSDQERAALDIIQKSAMLGGRKKEACIGVRKALALCRKGIDPAELNRSVFEGKMAEPFEFSKAMVLLALPDGAVRHHMLHLVAVTRRSTQ